MILQDNPLINVQFDNFPNILKLYRQRNIQQKRTNIENPSSTQQTFSQNNTSRSTSIDQVHTPLPTNNSLSIITPTLTNNNATSPYIQRTVSPNIATRINRLIRTTREISVSDNHQRNRYNLRPRANSTNSNNQD